MKPASTSEVDSTAGKGTQPANPCVRRLEIGKQPRLQTFGQFWVAEKVNATLNAWALINNLRNFLPDAKRADQFLVEPIAQP